MSIFQYFHLWLNERPSHQPRLPLHGCSLFTDLYSCSNLKPGLAFTFLLSSNLFFISVSHCLYRYLCWFIGEWVCTDGIMSIFPIKGWAFYRHTLPAHSHMHIDTADRGTAEAGRLTRMIKDVQSMGLLKYRPEGGNALKTVRMPSYVLWFLQSFFPCPCLWECIKSVFGWRHVSAC